MDVEDELRRVLREEKLDVPVRAGAEWSVMAGARRQRQRQNAFAALGGAVAATMLAGSAVVVINHRVTEPPATTPVPPAVQSSEAPGRSEDRPRSEQPPGEPGDGHRSSEADDPGQWADPSYPTSEPDESPTILHSTETSQPGTTTSEPTSSASEPGTTSDEPSSTAPEPTE